jgi:(p)ppGpp synthase/HD superfamily hydrolase
MKPELSLIEKAARIAVIAHADQKRKSDGFPYIIHPFMVAMKLMKYGFDDTTIAAALIHDVLEDTNLSQEEIKEELGGDVLEITKTVTEDKSLKWEDRKQKYAQAVKNGSSAAKAVSIADKIHNAENLIFTYSQIGSEIWGKFNRGRDAKIKNEEEMLKTFKESWSHPLIEEYEKLVEQMRKTQ